MLVRIYSHHKFVYFLQHFAYVSGTDSTAVDERPPVDKGKELFAGTSTKRGEP